MAQTDFYPGAINTALLVNDRFSKVYENALDQPVVTGVTLKVEAMPERRTAVPGVGEVEPDGGAARRKIEVEAMLHPYQADARMVRVKVKLPAD